MSDCQFPEQCGFPECFCIGKYRGTVNYYVEIYEVDEEYEEYLDTLTPEELEAERLKLEMQKLAIENMNLD